MRDGAAGLLQQPAALGAVEGGGRAPHRFVHFRDGDQAVVAGAETLFRVEAGSVEKSGETVVFSVTDLTNNVTVSYRGLLPDLFREGQGVVVQGAFDGNGQFVASEVLAKHDETYMPPEVAKALKESGRWQETEGKGDAAPVTQ